MNVSIIFKPHKSLFKKQSHLLILIRPSLQFSLLSSWQKIQYNRLCNSTFQHPQNLCNCVLVFELLMHIHRLCVLLIAGDSYVKLFSLSRKINHSDSHFTCVFRIPRACFPHRNNVATNLNFQQIFWFQTSTFSVLIQVLETKFFYDYCSFFYIFHEHKHQFLYRFLLAFCSSNCSSCSNLLVVH